MPVCVAIVTLSSEAMLEAAFEAGLLEAPTLSNCKPFQPGKVMSSLLSSYFLIATFCFNVKVAFFWKRFYQNVHLSDFFPFSSRFPYGACDWLGVEILIQILSFDWLQEVWGKNQREIGSSGYFFNQFEIKLPLPE